MVNFGNELCDVALAGENITNLKCLGLFCSLGNFFWLVYNDTGYIDIWVITLFMGLVIASLNWNLVTLVTFKSSTNALVCLQQMFLSCFMITLFTFKQSWQGLCGERTWPTKFLFYKYKLKRNHQDKITFKHYPNLLATIVCTFRLILSDHTAHIYIGFIHVDSVYAR